MAFSLKSSKSHATTPWRRRTAKGVYFGNRGAAWVYYQMPLTPLQWEDAEQRLGAGEPIQTLLVELGDTSADIGGGLNMAAIKREIHMFVANYDSATPFPEVKNPAQEDFLNQVLPNLSSTKAFLIGVKLRPQILRNIVKGSRGSSGNMLSQVKSLITSNSDNIEDSFDTFKDDFDDVDDIMRRNGAYTPEINSLKQLESWFNFGAGPDAQIAATPTELHVTGGGSWEISAVTEFNNPSLTAPDSQWLLDAMTHPDPAVVVSIRGDLLPPSVLQAQLRSAQRRLRSNEEEDARTGDISRDELGEKTVFAKDIENVVRSAGFAWVGDCSILMAREYDTLAEGNETYVDMLRSNYGIEAKCLEHRQIEALEEMQPCSTKRVNPFSQVVSPSMLAFSGAPAFSNIGDETGRIWMGSVDPDFVPLMLDEFGASNANLPPAMAIFGDPGSGKAQPLSAKILTPDGFKTMGDMKVGSKVLGRYGTTYEVKGVYPQGEQDIYKFTFQDKATTYATLDHLWTVRIVKQGTWQTRTTAQLINLLRKKVTVELPTFENSNVTSILEKLTMLKTNITTIDDETLTAELQSFGCLVFDTEVQAPNWLRPRLKELLENTSFNLSETKPVRRLQSIVLDGKEQAQCIKVSAPDSLYVTDDFVVTHNTFAAQLIAAQAAMGGTQVMMINPKGFDSLAPFAKWVKDQGVPSQVVSMQAAEEAEDGGAFDPFRFAEPQMAAEILTQHILAVLGSSYNGGLTGEAETLLGAALKEAAAKGARCAYDALMHVEDADTRKLVLAQVRASSLFGLAFGMRPQAPLGGGAKGFTLVEFDRALNLPPASKGYFNLEREERIALAAMRLVTRASMEILMKKNDDGARDGGMLIVDEAHHYLSSTEGLASLQRLGREGRSLKMLPIFCTQRVSDLLGADMENYLSRVLCLKMTDSKESSAALTLTGLQPTESRIKFLREAGPRRGSKGQPGRGALGFFRDKDQRKSVIMIGPVPDDLREAMSTNPEDREKQRLKNLAAKEQAEER